MADLSWRSAREDLLVIISAGESAYEAYVFGNHFPGALVATGAFAGDAFVLRSERKAGGQTMKLRNVTRPTAAGTMESEQYVAVKDAPEKLLVEVVATRKH